MTIQVALLLSATTAATGSKDKPQPKATQVMNPAICEHFNAIFTQKDNKYLSCVYFLQQNN